MTTPEQPHTEAGRALLNSLLLMVRGMQPDATRAAILAIEAQARPAVASEGLQEERARAYRDGYEDGQKRERLAARPAVASEGLEWVVREAMRDHFRNMSVVKRADHCDGNCEEGILVRIRAALASDAGSVGALDVRRAFMVLTRLRDGEVDEFAAKLIKADAHTVTPWLDAERQGES